MAGRPQGRGSEGVYPIRHPRSDFPQQGWIRKATVEGTTGDFYEALTDFGWYGQTQSFRADNRAISHGPRAKQYDYYQTTPQQGWMGKPVLTLFDTPAIQNWQIVSTRTPSSIKYQRDTNRDNAWIFVNLPAAGFDPSTSAWGIQSDRYKSTKARPNLNDSLYPPAAWNFADTLQDWAIKSERYKSRGWWTSQPAQPAWLSPAVSFDARLYPSIGQLVGGRTPSRATLKLSLLQYVYDVSFFYHDTAGGATTVRYRRLVLGDWEDGSDDWWQEYSQ